MEIKPFRAFRFDSAVVGDIGSCIAPPYDVISNGQREQLYRRNDYNIVHITKGTTDPSDNEQNNQYTRAAVYFRQWLAEGALRQDQSELIYAYVQDFEISGRRWRRSSFIALCRLEQFGGNILPHEETLTVPKLDRLRLRMATQADFGLVFMLYKDGNFVADKIVAGVSAGQPLIDFFDDHNVRHRLFPISDSADIESICRLMADKRCIIADGHHRYETALDYSRRSSSPAARYQMTGFVNSCHEGLVILATHRLISGLKDFDSLRLVSSVKADFIVTENRSAATSVDSAKSEMLSQLKLAGQAGQNAFGIYAGNGVFHTAVLKESSSAMAIAAPDKSPAWRCLDVSVLHKLVIERHLGIGSEQLSSGGSIEYLTDTDSAVDEMIGKIDSGRSQVAFFMNPATVRQIEQVTMAGEKIPRKSTFFYPKMFTGLTINKL